MSLDVEFARSQFPSRCWDCAFFENAGGSYVPQTVVDRVAAFMTENQVQPGDVFASSIRAKEQIQTGRRLMAELINADEDEVTISQSTRGNFYVLSHAIAPLLGAGDEIIVTNLDHESNIGNWRRLSERGVVIKEWRVDSETAVLDTDALEKLLTEKTRLVCFVHCSNITGGINDVARITKLAHQAGAWTCVDGVAYAAHRPIDVKALDVDFYALSFYKMFGPHISLLYGKRERLESLANQNFFFRGDIQRKLNPGDPTFELTAALPGVTDYLNSLYKEHFEGPSSELPARATAVFRLFTEHEERLAARFLDFITTEKRVRLIGLAMADSKHRVPTFSFRVARRKSQEIPLQIAAHGVAIAAGGFGVYRLITDLGIDYEDGVVRASMIHYNTLEEVDRLISALQRVI